MKEKLTDIFEKLNPKVQDKIKETLGTDDLTTYTFQRKAADSNAEFADGERAAVQWVSTKDLDRDGEILIPSGAVLDEFKLNPVVLWGHDYSQPPIGSDQWIKIDKQNGIKAKTVYASTDFAKDIFTLKKEGHLRSQSVGFIPIESVESGKDGWTETLNELSDKWGEDWSKWLKKHVGDIYRIIKKWILLEHSDVAVPANAQALVIAVNQKSIQICAETQKALNIDKIEIETAPEKVTNVTKTDNKETRKRVIIPVEIKAKRIIKADITATIAEKVKREIRRKLGKI